MVYFNLNDKFDLYGMFEWQIWANLNEAMVYLNLNDKFMLYGLFEIKIESYMVCLNLNDKFEQNRNILFQ
jgi:hypothetical protein